MRPSICHCRLCVALDEADACVHDHGVAPAQAVRHLIRQYPGLLEPRWFLAALLGREKKEPACQTTGV